MYYGPEIPKVNKLPIKTEIDQGLDIFVIYYTVFPILMPQHTVITFIIWPHSCISFDVVYIFEESIIKLKLLFPVLAVFLLVSCQDKKSSNPITVVIGDEELGRTKTPSQEDLTTPTLSKEERARLNSILNNNITKPENALVPKDITIDLKQSCNLIHNLEDNKTRERVLKENGEKLIYSTGTKKYYVKDLLANYFESTPFRAKENAKAFHDKLAKNAIQKILKNQKFYMGMAKIEDLTDQMEDLNSCLGSNKYFKDLQSEAKIDNKLHDNSQELYKRFIVNNLINAFKANILYGFKGDLESEKKRYAQEQARKRNRVYYRGNRDFHKRQKDEKMDKLKAQIKEAKTPIGVMLQQTPLLFDLSNDMSIDDWVNIQVERSEIMDFMLAKFDPKLMDQMTKEFKQNKNISSFKSVLFAKENQKYLDDYATELIESGVLQEMILSKLEDYINTVNNGATKICENEEYTLHHNEDLVKYTLDKNVQHDNYINQMTRDHVGYCQLLKDAPKEDLSAFTWKTGIGLTLLGVGAGAQVFLGLGNLIGIGLMGAGGAILTGETAYNSYISYEQEMRGQAIHFGGWSDFREVTDMLSQTGDLFTDIGTDAVLSIFGAGSGKLLKGIDYLKVASKDELLSGDSLINVSRFKRGAVNQALIEDGSAEAITQYKKLVWARHKEMWIAYKASAKRYKVLAKREWYRVRNMNDIPAYHIYGESGSETYGLLEIASNAKRLDTEEGQEAMKQINKWVEDYKSYKEEINETIEKGFVSKRQMNDDVLSRYKAEDFFNGKSQKVKVVELVDGEYKDVEKTFESYYELNKYIKEQESLSIKTFARNSFEELRNDSKVFQIMDQQAIDYRRLEFLRDKLKAVKNRTKDQQDMLDNALKLLKDEDLKPRPDALLRLQKKELAAERMDFIRSMKKKEKLLNRLQFKLTDQAANVVKETGFVGKYFKSFLIVGMGTVSTGGVTSYFKTGGTIDEITSSKDLMLNDLSRDFNNGYTSAERKCAGQQRNFSFGICFAQLAETELSVHRARAIVTEDKYTYEGDPTAKRIIYDLAYRILKLRKKLRGAELYMLATKILNNAYETHTERDIVELIIKTSGSQDLGAKAHQVLNAQSVDEAMKLLEVHTGDLGENFSKALLYIVNNKDKVVKSVKDSGRLPKEVEEIIQGIESDEANMDIIDKDFFEFSLGILEQVADV